MQTFTTGVSIVGVELAFYKINTSTGVPSSLSSLSTKSALRVTSVTLVVSEEPSVPFIHD